MINSTKKISRSRSVRDSRFRDRDWDCFRDLDLRDLDHPTSKQSVAYLKVEFFMFWKFYTCVNLQSLKKPDLSPSCGQNSKILSNSCFPYRKPPNTKKSADLENFLKICFFRWVPQGQKNGKNFFSDFDDFGVNHLLSSSPATFAMALEV